MHVSGKLLRATLEYNVLVAKLSVKQFFTVFLFHKNALNNSSKWSPSFAIVFSCSI